MMIFISERKDTNLTDSDRSSSSLSNSSTLSMECDPNANQMDLDQIKKTACAELRIEFLNALFKLTGKKCEIEFVKGTNQWSKSGKGQSAIFAGSDLQFNNIAVEQLETPLGTQPNALLRRTDIQTITFNI